MRVSGRALRRSKLSPPAKERGEQTLPSPSPQNTRPGSVSGKETNHGHELDCIGDGGDYKSTGGVVGRCGDDHGGGGGNNLSTKSMHVEDDQGRGERATTIISRRGKYARDGDVSPPGDSARGSGGQDVSSFGVPAGSGLSTVTPCTSDIWAWALIVLEMFSDEAWPPDSGQVYCRNRYRMMRPRVLGHLGVRSLRNPVEHRHEPTTR